MTFTFIMTLYNPDGAKNLYEGLNLFELYQTNVNAYKLMMSFIIFLAGYKAYIAFLVIRIFRKLNLKASFSEAIIQLITKISYSAFAIGILSLLAISYSENIFKKIFRYPISMIL